VKRATKDNLQIAALALGSIPVVLGFIGLLYWLGLDGLKWFGALAYTGLIFGVLAGVHPEEFKKPRWVMVYFAALAVHLTVLTIYLRGVSNFPGAFFFLFFWFPEIGMIAIALWYFGGGGAGRGRHRHDKGAGHEHGPTSVTSDSNNRDE
jgi:hypothetical protein